ncbi:MAG: adenylate cyclase [Lysobacterales bacterium]|jgi:adenylate cyclase
MSFFNELKRRNVFKVAAAYVIVGWLTMQVGDTLGPALLLPEWINSALAFFLILGFPLAMFFAWAFEMTPEGIKKEKDVDRGESITQVTSQKLNGMIIGLLVVALGYFAFDKFVLDPERDAELVSQMQEQAAETVAETEPEGPDEKSIAVLPFVNMSDDASNEFFSDGITEELLNLLAKIPELKVTSRSSAFSFKGQNIHIPTVAERLNVKHVLEGSVRKAGNRVRITAQLIEAQSDVHMWSETFDRELDDIFAIQDEIAREVVTVLQIQLLGEVPVAEETDTEAFTSYLQGKHLLETADQTKPLLAMEAFQKAIDIDPEYAPAWAGLARATRWAANWGEIDQTEGNETARDAARKALSLDDSSALAWAVLSRVQYVYDWDWYAAQGSIRTALALEPNNGQALEDASRIARAVGKFDEGVELALRAVEVDPLNPVLLRNLAVAYWGSDQHLESLKAMQRIYELYPEREGAQLDHVWPLINLGQPEEGLKYITAETEAYPENRETVALASIYVMHALGREDESNAALKFIVDNASEWLAFQVAEAYAWLGNSDKAFEWLEISYSQRDGGVTHLLGDPTMVKIHNDPRWEPYLLKLGLLDAWQNDAKPYWESRK